MVSFVLPKIRNETITDPMRIIRVPPKISAQDLFLVEEAPDEDGKTRNGEQGHHHAPSASGIAMNSQIAPAYIGWRTYA